ncbi:MAG TPA: amidohydrolase, partial [Thermoanaerobaculia bacterium]|nr:amidohydrolase [Thermoanaerobaculia bacterium]
VLLSMLTLPALAQTIDQRIDKELPQLLETYRNFHTHPELSKQEKETSAAFAKRLRELGYEVTERVGKYPDPEQTCYGVVAILKNGDGPVVLLRTDMDALPVTEQTGVAFASANTGVMHACGHDLHMTSMLGTAKLLADMKSSWRGTVMIVGQPAEEVVAGASGMLSDGLYERFGRPAYAVAVHDSAQLPAGQVGYTPGYTMASSDSVDVTTRGLGGHGAAPDKGKDPVVVAAEFIVSLQTIVSRERPPLDPVVVTVGSIHGGTKRNIIPDEVKLMLTVRTYKPEIRQRVLASIERIAKGIAFAAGIPDDRAPIVTQIASESTEATYNDPALAQRLAKSLQRELGAANVIEIDPLMVSEDFGRFGLDRKIPTAMLHVGAGDPARIAAGTQPGLHSSQFAPVADLALRTAIRTTVSSALELLKK